MLQHKCEQYWPDSGEKKYGTVTVTLLSTCRTADYVIRRLQLAKVGTRHHRRDVTVFRCEVFVVSIIIMIVQMGEIFTRGIWSLFRAENQPCNRVVLHKLLRRFRCRPTTEDRLQVLGAWIR